MRAQKTKSAVISFRSLGLRPHRKATATSSRKSTEPITVPTITIGSDFDGPNKNGTSYRKMFTGPYSHRGLDGVGHNVPQEAPQDFANAVIAVDGQ